MQNEEQILSLEDYQITKHFKEIQMAQNAKIKAPFFSNILLRLVSWCHGSYLPETCAWLHLTDPQSSAEREPVLFSPGLLFAQQTRHTREEGAFGMLC